MARKPAVAKAQLTGYEVTAVKRPHFDSFNRGGYKFSDSAPTFVPADDPAIEVILAERMLSCRQVWGEPTEKQEAVPEVEPESEATEEEAAPEE